MLISGNQWRWTASAFHSAIAALPIRQDHSEDARTAHGIHAEQPDSSPESLCFTPENNIKAAWSGNVDRPS
jgi:hypothetical protein